MFIWTLVGGVRGALAALAGAALMYAALSLYDIADDRAVAKAAREAQLAQFETKSAQALTKALLLAGEAQAQALASAQRDQLLLNNLHESRSALMEAEIEVLEKDLAARGRACLFDQSDVDWMLNLGSKGAGSGQR